MSLPSKARPDAERPGLLTVANPSHHLAALIETVSGPVVLAVSGGSDSTALLMAVAEARDSGWPVDPVAVTVDHGLRTGSAAEAQAVAALCARIGVRHVTKTWNGPKPVSSVQEQARAMRRVLLCEAAGECGAPLVLTGHTLDDQIETLAMRQKRGDGPGLAGIAPASLAFNDRADGSRIWFVRPFLTERRGTLRNYLTGCGVAWIDDPSNENSAFERVSIRQELNAAGEERFLALRYIQREAAEKRRKISREAARLLSFYASEPATGLLKLDPGIFQSANLEAVRLTIQVLAAFAGGSVQPADARIADMVIEAALVSGFGTGRKPSRRSASGAIIDIRKDGVWFMRESRRSTSAALQFDGRYRALGAGRARRESAAQTDKGTVAASLVQHALAGEPKYLCDDDKVISAAEAAQSGLPVRRLINPWPDLVPGFDVKLAEKLSELAGEGGFPPCPIHPDGKN